MINFDRVLVFDGATGTMLQKMGVSVPVPEALNITSPEIPASIHRAYLEAGSDVILTNTFGANRFKAEACGYPLEMLVSYAVKIARSEAAKYKDKYVGLSVGPCGRVLEPYGDTHFDEAVEIFAEVVRHSSGADFILFETFTDLNELRAAVVAAKENTTLPIIATMSFEASGTTFFGTTVESMIMTLEALGVSALGVNCSLGPKQLVPIVEKLVKHSRIPVLVQPNAGLPVLENGLTKYDITADEFAAYAKSFVDMGVACIGGCCGTSPEYISKLCACVTRKRAAHECVPLEGICTAQKQAHFIRHTIIGERLNPTGKKKLKGALLSGDFAYLKREAINQEALGADALDLNVGLPELDEAEVLTSAVKNIQSVTNLPLVLDSSSPEALERAARVYCGKALINSVNGSDKSLDAILPIAKKYGCAVLGLTLDEHGVPHSADERLKIARKIVRRAEEYGIDKRDIFIDALTLTVSADAGAALETLHAVELIKRKLGVKTILGVSNVSFGLPARTLINRTMLAMAFACGLDGAIMNPQDSGMIETVAASRLLFSNDNGEYIERYAAAAHSAALPQADQQQSATPQDSIEYAVIHGMKEDAAECAKKLLSEAKNPLEIVEGGIIPALDAVGREYETGAMFLPQLIYAAEAAQAAFDVLRPAMENTGTGEKFIIATVQGDIHDIGKNIVKLVMANYNFDVVDLGKNVAPERVVAAVRETGARLVGLSALMTTTVSGMRETIALLRKECPDVKIIVGGAVLTPELARTVGADEYARDAMATVAKAEALSKL